MLKIYKALLNILIKKDNDVYIHDANIHHRAILDYAKINIRDLKYLIKVLNKINNK